MPKKIAIIGPECSGKSTLTQELANHFSEPFLPEYGRIYLEIFGPSYQYEDLEKISKKMVELEAKQIKNASNYLFCDTDLIMMKVWYEYKYDKVGDYLQQALKDNPYDFYLICRPDIPWKADPLRENPHIREELFESYLSEVKKLGKPFLIIDGKNREEQAIQHIEANPL